MKRKEKSESMDQMVSRMTKYLKRNGCFFSSQPMEDGKGTVFDILMEPSHWELTELRITVFVCDDMVCFRAIIPVSSTDKDSVVLLVNELNVLHSEGMFQYCLESEELAWTQYLPARRLQWPGDNQVNSAFRLVQERTALLCAALYSEMDKAFIEED